MDNLWGDIKKTFPSTGVGHFGSGESLEEKDCQAEGTINDFSCTSRQKGCASIQASILKMNSVLGRHALRALALICSFYTIPRIA
jgi:hypothetical protein